ncbi:carbon-nitrogen hydrolase family protein [Microbacterium sp. STN6]|uniref:carbon-nitrogen hydrolase family protein n=1 Tax=Microbacterium sp. STN6 TaxID=2995588 RepID=UPI002260FB3E|nr:carbon-nitrogen hydrolase family protein [Microbacterium sp. STN6]MCX7521972.1 carbon-nitrogen hydrolase family protein [Microbacterium sp. STN6]
MDAPPELAVAVAQFAPTADTRINLDAMRTLTRKAVSRGARLVVFPEYSSYFEQPLGESMVTASQAVDGPFVSELAALAASERVHIVAGLLERANDPGRFHNTVVAVSPAGELVATYRKQHLYDAFGASESRWVVPGDLDEPQLFTVDGVRVGMQTCYDIRFPELSRRITDAGADLILVPAEWVRGPLKEHHWRTLLTSRALENTVYVAAADHAPPSGVGGSVIIDPMGVELASLGEQTDTVLAWVSPARLAETRRVNPSLAMRRYRVEPR